jgi:hypothetical protein
MNKRTVILIVICCLLAVATVTMRYIEQEIAIIREKFVGQKKTEERSMRSTGSVRQAPTRKPQSEKAPATAKQNAIRPAAPDVRKSPPAATTAAPVSVAPPRGGSAAEAAKAANTTTTAAPGKKPPMENAIPDRNAIAAVEEMTAPLVAEPGVEAQGGGPLPKRSGAADVQAAAAADGEEKIPPAAGAERGNEAGSPAVAERSEASADEGVPEERGSTEEAAADGEGDEIQGEDAVEEGGPSSLEEGEAEEEQAAGEEETLQGADEAAAEQGEEVVDEE